MSVRGEDLQKQLNALWTVQDVCAEYGVTPMTVHLWRTNRSMPAVVINGHGRPAVRFVPAEVRKWAKDKGVTTALAQAG